MYAMYAFFSDEWQNRWVESKSKPDYGKWQLSAGKFWGDPEKDKGKLHMTIIGLKEQ